MTKTIERIESKIDKIQEKIETLSCDVAAQQEVLNAHVKRTGFLEKEVEPIKKHVILMSGMLKLLGTCGGILGMLKILSIVSTWLGGSYGL